ncbi:dihydroneopterin aldolase [bacterium]|nr:dihydroneopterin aldolase [candidate division CSSED10-310 bacterium]
MEDKIIIKDLLVRGIIGINDWEREKKQDILVNIELLANLGQSCMSDSIDDTVNYRTLAKHIIALVETTQRYTLEALANDIMKVCFFDSRVKSVRVRVEKPGALRFAKSVGIEIDRRRELTE